MSEMGMGADGGEGRFRAGANPVAERLAVLAGGFRARPVAGGGGFVPLGPGAGGPVGAMIHRIADAFDLDAGCAPELDGEEGGAEPDAAPDPEQLLADAEARGREEGFAAGEAAGRQAAEAAFGLKLTEFDRLLRALAAARACEPEAVEAALAETALHLIAELLEADPEPARASLMPRVAGAAARLGERLADAELRLNPADYAALAVRVDWPGGLRPLADPEVTAGGFRLLSGESRIEDCLAARLERLAAHLRAPA